MYQLDEKTGLVTVTLTKEDYDRVLLLLGYATGVRIGSKGTQGPMRLETILGLMDRMNEGNPNYRPYTQPKPGECPDCWLPLGHAGPCRFGDYTNRPARTGEDSDA